MNGRRAGRMGWMLAALSVLLLLTGTGLSVASAGIDSWPSRIAATAVVVAFSAAGAMIAAREPRNPIGWIFCQIAIAGSLMSLSRGYAEFWLDGQAASETLGEIAAWYGDISWVPVVLPALTFLLLLFPDGRLLAPRWRAIAWCAGIGIPAVFLADGWLPGPLEDYPGVVNPFGVEGVAREIFQGLAYLLLLVAIAGSPLSLVIRFRRAGAEQRQQIKWLALAGMVAAATLVVGVAAYDTLTADVADAAILLSVLCMPLATAIAILRHRLYDVDVVINRTLVYAALSATLAAVYIGSVLLLQLALSGITEGSGLAVAASTLAVAFVFRPARARIQAGVDRRFYRRRYDARLTLEAFSVRLRSEIDLGALELELRGAVRETLQPAHVSLWMRPR